MNMLADQLGMSDLSPPTIADILFAIQNLERNIMSDFDQLLAEVESQGSMLAELTKVVSVVHDHVVVSTEGTAIPIATQTKINTAMAAIVANRQVLASALEKMHTAAAMAAAASSESTFKASTVVNPTSSSETPAETLPPQNQL